MRNYWPLTVRSLYSRSRRLRGAYAGRSATSQASEFACDCRALIMSALNPSAYGRWSGESYRVAVICEERQYARNHGPVLKIVYSESEACRHRLPTWALALDLSSARA